MTTPQETKAAADKKMADNIAFGVEQTVLCTATDFVDPYVGSKIIKMMGGKGDLKHTGGGELIGDGAALFGFLAVARWAPKPMEWLSRAAGKIFRKSYEHIAHANMQDWAQRHNTRPGEAEYQKKFDEWKQFQADSFAKSSIISALSVAINVASQKLLLRSPDKTIAILAGKIAGAGITSGIMLGARAVMPRTMRQMDEELSSRYALPLVRAAHKVVGVTGLASSHPSEGMDSDATAASPPPGPISQRVAQQRQQRDELVAAR